MKKTLTTSGGGLNGVFEVKVPDPADPRKTRTVTLTRDQILALESGAGLMDSHFGLPRSPLFRDLESRAIVELSQVGRRRRLTAGSTIFDEDESADALYLVVSGRIRTTNRDTHGRVWSFFDLSTATTGELFGCEAVVSEVRHETATAVDDAVVLQVFRDDFLALLKSYPTLALNFAIYEAERLKRGTLRFAQFSGAFTVQRLAMVLKARAESEGIPDSIRGRVRIPSPITHEELASMIGTTRESVVAGMKKLENVVTRKGKFYTVDVDGLNRAAEA